MKYKLLFRVSHGAIDIFCDFEGARSGIYRKYLMLFCVRDRVTVRFAVDLSGIRFDRKLTIRSFRRITVRISDTVWKAKHRFIRVVLLRVVLNRKLIGPNRLSLIIGCCCQRYIRVSVPVQIHRPAVIGDFSPGPVRLVGIGFFRGENRYCHHNGQQNRGC